MILIMILYIKAPEELFFMAKAIFFTQLHIYYSYYKTL